MKNNKMTYNRMFEQLLLAKSKEGHHLPIEWDKMELYILSKLLQLMEADTISLKAILANQLKNTIIIYNNIAKIRG